MLFVLTHLGKKFQFLLRNDLERYVSLVFLGILLKSLPFVVLLKDELRHKFDQLSENHDLIIHNGHMSWRVPVLMLILLTQSLPYKKVRANSLTVIWSSSSKSWSVNRHSNISLSESEQNTR